LQTLKTSESQDVRASAARGLGFLGKITDKSIIDILYSILLGENLVTDVPFVAHALSKLLLDDIDLTKKVFSLPIDNICRIIKNCELNFDSINYKNNSKTQSSFKMTSALYSEFYPKLLKASLHLRIREAVLGVPDFREKITTAAFSKTYCTTNKIPLIEITHDSNCFFAAMLQASKITTISPDELRQQAVDYFWIHFDLHRDLSNDQLDSYARQMLKKTCWVTTGPIIDATARFLNVTLVIIELVYDYTDHQKEKKNQQQNVFYFNNVYAKKKIILFRSQDNHYDAVDSSYLKNLK
jgi:hypothetical protein